MRNREDAAQKARELVSQMTLEEKASQLKDFLLFMFKYLWRESYYDVTGDREYEEQRRCSAKSQRTGQPNDP